MTQAINTSDALAASLTHLFGRDADTGSILEFVSGLALTVDAAVVEGASTPYGRSFRTTGGTPVQLKGVTFAAETISTAAPVSVFVVTNGYVGYSAATANAGVPILGSGNAGLRVGAGMQLQPATGKFCPTASNTVVADATMATAGLTAGSITSGAKSFGYSRSGTGDSAVVKAYIDGAVDANFSTGDKTQLNLGGGGWTTAAFSQIGGFPERSSWASFDFVYIAVFRGVALSAADFSRLHASLTGSNNFALLTAPSGDTTVPTLTGSIAVTSLATTSYTLTWPAGTDNVAVAGYDYSLDGGTTWVNNGTALTVNITGRTAGASDQVRVRARDAAGNFSTPVLSTVVTLLAGGDAVVPVLTGAIAISNLAASAFTATCSAASDNSGSVSYDWSGDGGVTWVTAWPAPTYNFSSLMPSTTYPVRVRARDPSGNLSTPVLAASATTLSAVAFTSEALKNNTGTVLANKALMYYRLYDPATGALVVSKGSLSTNSSGVVSFSDSALIAGTVYKSDWLTAEGHYRMPSKAAA